MSDFIRWQNNWALKIPHLDQQHLVLVERINQIAELVTGRSPPTAAQSDVGRQPPVQRHEGRCADVPEHSRLICDHVEELIEETRAHFQDEEALMLRLDYPSYHEHKREHGILLAELVDLARQVRQGTEQMGLQTLTALKHWLIVHIVTSDQAYAEHYHSRGLAPDSVVPGAEGRERSSSPNWTGEEGNASARVSGGH